MRSSASRALVFCFGESTLSCSGFLVKFGESVVEQLDKAITDIRVKAAISSHPDQLLFRLGSTFTRVSESVIGFSVDAVSVVGGKCLGERANGAEDGQSFSSCLMTSVTASSAAPSAAAITFLAVFSWIMKTHFVPM